MTKKSAQKTQRAQDDIKLEAFLPYRFYLITASLSGLLLEKLRPHGVTVQRWRVLMVLANEGPKNISQLVDLTFIPQSGLSRVVDQMERDRLVVRSSTDEDSRRVTVSITDEGRAIYQQLVPVVRDYADALTRGFSKDERKNLAAFLGRVQSNLSERARQTEANASEEGMEVGSATARRPRKRAQPKKSALEAGMKEPKVKRGKTSSM